jgi:CRP-like cAMP-binding protein
MQELLRKYHTGTFVFREGEAGDYAYVLRTGKIRQYKTVGRNEIVLDQMLEGELFGESALVERVTRPVSASVVAASEIYVIDRRLYLQRLTALDTERAKALQNLHVFVHRTPLYDAQWRRVVPKVADDIAAKMRALLDSDLAASLTKTADPVIDLVAEQLRDMAARRLPNYRKDPEMAEFRERIAARLAPTPVAPAPAPAPAPVAKQVAAPAKPAVAAKPAAATPPRPTITSA